MTQFELDKLHDNYAEQITRLVAERDSALAMLKSRTEQVTDLEQKLATSHLKFTLLGLELEREKQASKAFLSMALLEDEPYDGRAAEVKRLTELEQRREEIAVTEALGLSIGIDMAASVPPTPESLEMDQVMNADPELQEIFEENSTALDGKSWDHFGPEGEP